LEKMKCEKDAKDKLCRRLKDLGAPPTPVKSTMRDSSKREGPECRTQAGFLIYLNTQQETHEAKKRRRLQLFSNKST
jgi:hypothetical protein